MVIVTIIMPSAKTELLLARKLGARNVAIISETKYFLRMPKTS